MTCKISQRQARYLLNRVKVLEAAEKQRRLSWADEWPGGVNIGSVSVSGSQAAAIRTARKLKHAVVVTFIGESDTAKLFALPLAVQP